MNHLFKTVPTIEMGAGCSLALNAVCEKAGISKPFIVSDPGVVNCGLLEPALGRIADYVLYQDVVADPPQATVEEAVAMAIEARCDGVVGFGGGSSMDVAKLVAVAAMGEQPLTEMYGVGMVKGQRLPLIQIPTTAGTGSEATAVAIVTTGEHTKSGVVSDQLFADVILLDAELTVGLPPAVTAATGIDAMVHAIEAYTSKRLKNPISDMLALKALSLLSANIKTAVNAGSDLVARENMLLGAMFAGQAFANSPVGAVHALAYPLGGIYHIPHGLSNSLVLPHVLRFNATSASALYDELASVVFGAVEEDTGAAKLADYFYSLAQELGLPVSLRDMKIQESGLVELAEQAMLQERLLINNPRTVSQEEALSIYQQAY